MPDRTVTPRVPYAYNLYPFLSFTNRTNPRTSEPASPEPASPAVHRSLQS